MVLKNFIFRQDWVGRKVTDMKKNLFFAIFNPTWTHILVLKTPNKEFLKQHFRKDRKYIIINFVTLRLTNSSESIEYYQFFPIFNPNWAKIWP